MNIIRGSILVELTITRSAPVVDGRLPGTGGITRPRLYSGVSASVPCVLCTV